MQALTHQEMFSSQAGQALMCARPRTALTWVITVCFMCTEPLPVLSLHTHSVFPFSILSTYLVLLSWTTFQVPEGFLSSIPRTHIVEGEKHLCKLSSDLHDTVACLNKCNMHTPQTNHTSCIRPAFWRHNSLKMPLRLYQKLRDNGLIYPVTVVEWRGITGSLSHRSGRNPFLQRVVAHDKNTKESELLFVCLFLVFEQGLYIIQLWLALNS